MLQDTAAAATAALPFFRTLPFYKYLHLLGMFLAMTSLGGIAIHAANGGTKATARTRGLTAGVFGLGMLIVIAGGFGQAARLGVMANGIPGWLWAKIGIWVIVALLSILPYRIPVLARPIYLLVPLLGGLAAYLAIYHGL
ncbi:MAG: hypothetical protein IT355_18280 [Gemmatimonadaceae bacterium]|nr:hypothetical protein [Gemmatimonadaceae bacterium]